MAGEGKASSPRTITQITRLAFVTFVLYVRRETRVYGKTPAVGPAVTPSSEKQAAPHTRDCNIATHTQTTRIRQSESNNIIKYFPSSDVVRE